MRDVIIPLRYGTVHARIRLGILDVRCLRHPFCHSCEVCLALYYPQSLIDKGVEYAQEAKAQLDNAQADAKALLVEAQKQQMEILHEAAQMKTHIIEEARQAASVEAKKVMDAAAVSIEQARKESELQFRREVSEFALQIAEKMMRKQLSDDKTQVEMIDKLLNEIENQN